MIRKIEGCTGLGKCKGVDEIESHQHTSVRIVDRVDATIALRIGTQEYAAVLTPEEAHFISDLLVEAAARAEERKKHV